MIYPSFRALTLCALILASCGQRPATTSHMAIIGGEAATYRPYYAQLMSGDTPIACGGVLIADRVVLTAATCLAGQVIQDLSVGLGLTQWKDVPPEHRVKVKGAFRHEKFNGDAVDGNDLVLLYVEDYKIRNLPREISPLVWEVSSSKPLPASVLAIGTGSRSNVGRVSTVELREVTLNVLPRDACEGEITVLSSQFCAQSLESTGRGLASGDAGGPVVRVNADGTETLVGLISRFDPLESVSKPQVVTLVPSFTPWLRGRSEILQRDVRPSESLEDLKYSVATRCLGQVGHIVHEEGIRGVQRQTVWSIDALQVEYQLTEDVPSGTVVSQCAFEDSNQRKTSVSWIRTAAPRPTFIAKVVDSKGQTYVSTPWKTKYIQDRIACETPKGPIGLFDQRRDTLVQVGDQFYQLGDPVTEPQANDITWGCKIAEVSLDIFIRADAPDQLNARIKHRSIGSEIRTLVPANIEPTSLLQLSMKKKGAAADEYTLRLKNVSPLKLYTWKISCHEPFKLKLSDGVVLESEPTDARTSAVVIDHGDSVEGILGRDVERTWDLIFMSGNAPQNCVLNDVFSIPLEL